MKKIKLTGIAKVFAAAILIALGARADVTLPAIFSDHMVLQREVSVPVWGWAAPGETVTVAFEGQTKTTTADPIGKWKVNLDKITATNALTLTVKGQNVIEIRDVLVGEVWLASGQSNMQMPVNEANNAAQEKAAAKFPQIRMFTVGRRPEMSPQTNCEGKWVVCSPETVGSFSAAAYFFARELHQTQAADIGVINASWGGTPIEAWMSMPSMNDPEFAPVFKPWQEKMSLPYDAAKARMQYVLALEAWTNHVRQAEAIGKPTPPRPRLMDDPRRDKNYPANLFNGMIAPIIPYAIRGTIWYQGENNAGSNFPWLYVRQLSLMIKDWRERWGQGEFPFAWVQLPNFNPGTEGQSKWPIIRECMRQCLSVANTGMAVTIDVGDPKNIHPKNKQVVGHRLALWARAAVYKEKIPFSGPLFAAQKIEGDKIVLSFIHSDGGLVSRGGDIKGFYIAAADRKWNPAIARIEGDHLVVSSVEVKSPVAVRYAWAANPDCNFFNGEGLPASPFRTDDWE